jgi:Fic family protein
VIAENKHTYYKAFEDAENPLNCSEISFFVLQMLRFIQTAQRRFSDNLQEKDRALNTATKAMIRFAEEQRLDAISRGILSILIQQRLFLRQDPELTRAMLAEYENVGQARIRSKLELLTRKGLIATVGKRPICYQLSNQACELFGIETQNL